VAFAHCPSTHYSLNVSCTLGPGHRDIWHQATLADTGTLIRYRRAFGARTTQEWVPANDPGEPDAGHWVTLHVVQPEADPTPTVPADLDRRAAAMLSQHFETGGHRPATGESECACGVWHPALVPSRHIGREVSLLARGYYDVGRRDGAGEVARMLREYCPVHGEAETSLVSCHCPAAVEIDRIVNQPTVESR